jgi:biopolymer transport protein ExbB/TolQ
MLSGARQNKMLVIFVVVTLLILVSLVKATTNVKKFKNNFQEEMAQRLDLEEKIAKMEKERAGLLSDSKKMKEDLQKERDELSQLKNKLAQEEDERSSLEKALEKARATQKTHVSSEN